ncbi:MAG: type IX secretion system membrane protein PorP/SprF [Bacteroidales bacterium]|jgi:type IX secretion system PorP/SprF family membrane protein|nr:type IX secretion system membrane protein PorP/SprF [Bacteroidales bacterium]
MLRRYFLTAFVLFCTLSLSAQDAIFSQFYAAPLYINPALAGANKCGRFSANYRNQWAAIPGAFSCINASFDKHIRELSGAIGVIVTNVREGNGAYSTTDIGAIYSYNLQVNDVFSIKLAAQASFVNRHIDWSNLTFADQYIEMLANNSANLSEFPTGEQFPDKPASKNYADFSTGIVGYSENFYAGFAIHHLSRPDEGFNGGMARLPMKFTVHAGAVIDLVPKQRRFRAPNAPTLSPNIIYQQQGAAQYLNYGLYATNLVQFMVFGVWYRQTIAFDQPESLTFLIGFQHNSLRVGYSYDLALNQIVGAWGGSHELSVGYNLACSPPKSKIKMINCPSF